jgi:threonine dehydratase
VNLIARVIDRGLFTSGRLTRLRCTVDDVPGALSRVLDAIARTGANVLEVEHERLSAGLELGQSVVELLLETRGPEHIDEVQAALSGQGVANEATPRFASRGRRVPL